MTQAAPQGSHPAQSHPALTEGRAAVITGAAGGIGLATAKRFAERGMKLCLADLGGPALEAAADAVAKIARKGKSDVIAVATDVSKPEEVRRLKDTAYAAFGEVAVLMNNAAIGNGGGPWENYDRWRQLLEVNLWGVINGVQVFAPAMIAQHATGAIINTGSKQGITTPPGDTAYNVSKAGVKVLTEAVAHQLRNTPDCRITAHLLIPGYTFTGITGAKPGDAKPDAAWTPEQVADFLLQGMAAGDFYILCPDNAVTRETDNRRMQWAMEDIIKNRPALSRWHPDYKDAFEAFVKG
jgi:NAD(P)-dependent dehydrogenase (short-subunit alcohol dehydrogenase family)